MFQHFKSYFKRGLAVLLPTILTIWIFVWGYKFIQENISIHVNRGLVWLTIHIKGLDWQNPDIRRTWEGFWINGWGSIAGFFVSLVGVCIIGAVLASVIGKTLWRAIERFIENIPLLKQVYPYIKQITDFLLTKDKLSFSQVVAVEYPRKGIWSIGLVTGSGIKKLTEGQQKEFLTVFVATSPSPFTGFAMLVPKDETMDIGMTVEEALRFIMSGGVISPQTEAGQAWVTIGPKKE